MADIDDFEKLQERYGGEFIALQYDRIVAHGKTFSETRGAVEKMNLRDVRYQFVRAKPVSEPKRRAG